MGGGTFSYESYRAFSASTAGKTTEEVYTSRTLDKTLSPYGVKIRESRDSADNPLSTPLIVALDVTGSMGRLADVIAREGLGTLFKGIFERKPITNPHVMFMGIGDVHYDSAPLQVSQFEADNRIVDQLTKLWIEKGGGGNQFESYDLAWYFAGFHTDHDSLNKRGKRGYLFTVGDEYPPAVAPTREQLRRTTGVEMEQQLTSGQLLEVAQRKYDVYHILIAEGNHARAHLTQTQTQWNELLGQHVITLHDHTKLAETIVTALEVAEGRDAATSAAAWGGATAGIVHAATKSLPRGRTSPPLLGA